MGTVLAMVLAVMWWMGLAELGGTEWFVLWPVAGTGGWLLLRCRGVGPSGYVFRREHLLLAGLFAAVVFSLTQMGTYYRNGVESPGGGLRANLYPDLRLHLSITNEIRHTWPPEIPFLAGAPLRYHVGMDVLPNLYLSVCRFEPLDLMNRFLPTLLFGLLALGAYCVGTQCLRSRFMAVCFAALVIFGDDFYAFAKMWDPDLSPDYHLPTLNSLFFHNPNLHGLVVMFASFVALNRFIRSPSAGALVPTAVLLAGSMLFKVFLAAHLMATLGVVAVASWVLTRDRRMLAVTLGVCASLVPVLFLMRHGLANGNTEFGIRPLAGLEHPGWFFLITLGMRLLALPALAWTFVRAASTNDLRFFLAVFVLTGTVLGLMVRVGTVGQTWNNGFWFYVAAKYILWLFVLETIERIPFALARLSLLTVTLALAFVPSVLFIQMFSFAKLPGVTYTSADGRLIDWMRSSVPAGAIVLPEGDFALPLSALTECRTVTDPVLSVFAPSFMTTEEFAGRHRDCGEFWREWDVGNFREEILARRGVAFLIVQPSRQPSDPLRAKGTSPVYDDGTYRVYDVRPAIHPAAEPAPLR